MNLPAPRNRRVRSYWEPIYDPGTSETFEERSWDLNKDKGPTGYTFTADRLAVEISEANVSTHFKGITFTECDFFGYFNQVGRVITFVDCTFIKCDFGLTTWEKTKFTNCRFISTSLTQATFDQCEFREIHWEKIGLSGNETRLFDCIFDHPEAFIQSAWTNTDLEVLRNHNKSHYYQLAKLENEKSVLSRIIFNGLQRVGTEEAFYQASKTNLRQQGRTKLSWNIYNYKNDNTKNSILKLIPIFGVYTENILIDIFGFINNWGASILRPLLLMFLVIVAFSAIYYMFGYPYLSAFAKSFEITLVAGYTKGAAAWVPPCVRLIEWMNLVFGIGIYTVLFATIVARICRVR